MPKLLIYARFLPLALLIISPAFCQTDSTILEATTNTSPEDAEFNLFLFTFVSLGILGLISAVTLGAIIAIAFLVLMFLSVTLGLLSVATVAGFYKRSVTTGFRVFIKLLLGFGCAVAACVGFIVLDALLDFPLSRKESAIIGLVSGALGGLLFDWMLLKIVPSLFRQLLQRAKESIS